MNRKGFTHQVLVAGDVQHWFALFTSRLGTGRIGTGAAARTFVPSLLAGAAGTELTGRGGLLGHLPEKSAHRMGLIDDGMGDVPATPAGAGRRSPGCAAPPSARTR